MLCDTKIRDSLSYRSVLSSQRRKEDARSSRDEHVSAFCRSIGPSQRTRRRRAHSTATMSAASFTVKPVMQVCVLPGSSARACRGTLAACLSPFLRRDARVWTPPSASLTAIPPAPAVVPAGDAPVRVPGQHLHAEGRRRAREGGHHRAEYVPLHRLETHRGATGAPAFPL